MKITIGHIFHDLLNLYGESGNITALENAFKQQNIDVDVRNLSLDNEPWNLDDLDILYIGAGTEQNQLLALSTLIKYKDDIDQIIKNNKFIIATGNSIELFGKVIKHENTETSALGIFEYSVERTNKRIVAECVFNYDKIDSKILGFENHQGMISNVSEPLFTVEKGFSSDLRSKCEGVTQNNFYGTYLLGPLLVRNPELIEKICKDVISNKDKSFHFKEFNFELEKKAHDKFLTKYAKD